RQILRLLPQTWHTHRGYILLSNTILISKELSKNFGVWQYQIQMEKKTTSLHYALNNPTRMPHLVKLKNAGLYVIYTRYCLEFLNEILKYPEFLRIIYNRGIDTCKHLVLLDDSMIERLNQERWTYIDFRPYMVDKERNLPPTGRSYNLYIKCPVTIPQDECVNIIN